MECVDENICSILELLESTIGKTERSETYQKFTRLFKENEISLFAVDVVKNIGRILNVIKKDIFSTSLEVNECALQVLGVCLHDSEISRSMSLQAGEDILVSLIDCIYKTEEKTTCTRALWCLGKQNLPADAVRKQVAFIVEAVVHSVEKFGSISVTVEHESINTIARLAEQCPREMEGESLTWVKILLPTMVHPAIKVRERGLNVVESTLELFKKHRTGIVVGVMPVFKKKVLPEMQKLFNHDQEIFVMRCWGVIVQVFGEELHHGSYANPILPVVELGFKSQSHDVKIAAFQAWQHLIDNFATNPNVLGDPKRIKLIMQVFKVNNAKQEKIALVKMKVWWHFIWLLGNKVTANFDMVAAPLLRFCLGGSKNTEQNGPNTPRMLPNGTSPMIPRMNLTGSNANYPVIPSLQLFGCEALAHFLGSTQQWGSLIAYDFKLDNLRQDVVTGPSFYIKQSHLLITTATELFISLGKDVPESLLFHIWQWLIVHMKNAIESPAKLDIRDTLNTLLTRFQVVVLNRVLSSHILMKMFQSVCDLPEKILSSSAYSVGGNEMIDGTPALFLAGLLLTPWLLQSCSGQEKESYHTLFKSIVNSGLGNSSGTLRFLQSLLEFVKSNGQCVEDTEMVWRLWSTIVHPLLDHISATNEVNQGDSLEPNFDCCVQALTFPLELKLANMTQPTVKSLVKTWSELYKTVNRLASMVTNASANIICEELCHKILHLNKVSEMTPENVDLQIQLCHVITSCLDFSSIGTQSTFNLAAAYSPKKAIKKRHQPLENIHSMVTLVCHLQKHAVEIVGDSEQKKVAIPLQSMMNNLVDLHSTLFTHVTSSSIISTLIGQLAQPMGLLFSEASKKSSAKVYNNAFQQKLEKLWMDICTCLQSRYTGFFDSEFLAQLSPLLEATFLHSRRQIKNRTVMFWSSTFGSASTLEYPEALRPVLTKAREKSMIQLPGWAQTNTIVIEETPISQMSQSQIPEPRIMGMPSPHKVHGSFLNKAVSPKPSKSPLKSPVATRAGNSAKKKVFKGLDALNDDDFVVIQASPKKKMVLTDHQREVMKERRVLPAMYNNLELSMDASMMSNHFTTESQMESSNSTPTPTTDKVPFSLFGSVLNTSTDQAKKSPCDKNTTGSGEGKSSKKKEANTHDLPAPKVPRRQTRAAGMKSPDSSVEIDLTKDTQDTPIVLSGDTLTSLPQNVLSVVGFTPPSSSSSGEKVEGKSMQDSAKTSEDLTLKEETLNKETLDINKDFDKELPSSEPLFSWSQKLEALSQSPGVKQSPLRKSLSQDSKSPSKRGKSPIKSPLKSPKGKSKENLSGMIGALDNWVIRSPGKNALVNKQQYLGKEVQLNTDIVVQSALSCTLVEETQSPTKFNKREMSDKTNSPSIMETPTKTILEEIDVNNSHSNRKLFDSQNDNRDDVDMVEDSNLIPASPTSKSFSLRSGTPIVKMKKLTNAEIMKFSPTNKQKGDIHLSLTPTKDHESPSKSAKCVVNFDMKGMDDESSSSHVHDDFSDLKPLENDTDFSNAFSKSLTSTDKALLKIDEKLDSVDAEQQSVSDIEGKSPCKTMPVSPTLFSQFTETNNVQPEDTQNQSISILVNQEVEKSDNQSVDKSETQSNKKSDNQSADKSENQSNKKSENQSNIGPENEEKLVEDDGACENLEKASQGFSTESTSEPDDSLVETQEKQTPRRGRKRKQITPKKMSPNDAKLQKKKSKIEAAKEKTSEGKVQRKNSVRLKEKKLKQQNSQENEEGVEAIEGENTKGNADDLQDKDNKEKQVIIKLDGSQVTDDELMEIDIPDLNKPGDKVEVKADDVEVKADDHKVPDVGDKVNIDNKDTSKLDVDKTDEEIQVKQLEKSTSSQIKNADNPSTKENTSENCDEQVEIEVDKTVAETTPKSRNASKMPERRSTTKHKKEVSQKMVLRTSQENRDELIMDTDSNLGGEDHFGKSNSSKTVKEETKITDKIIIEENSDLKVKGKTKSVKGKLLDSEGDELIKSVTEQLEECEKEELTIAEVGAVIKEQTSSGNDKTEEKKPSDKQRPKGLSDASSSQSDDDVPLSQLKNKKSKRKSVDTTQINKKESNGPRSPVSNKLRSNKVGTRLRSGQTKGKTSPLSKKSVNLALKRTRMKQKQTVETDMKELESTDLTDTVDETIEPLVNIDKVEKEFERDTAELNEKLCVEKQNDKSVPDSFQELFNSESFNDKKSVLEAITVKESANTNETPKKLIDKSKQIGNMMITNSDSKLVLGSRRFEKRKAVARRSILKPSAMSLSDQVGSPKRPDFHPIIVGQVYSPTASPSASILKKRRLLDVVESDINSPPTKQRRVSFAEPLEEAGNALTDMTKATMETEAANVDKNVVPLKQTGSQFSQSSSVQSSEGSISQGTYQSTQESQMNALDPVCPDLVDCEQSVEKILPQLTSSIWSRGLGQLIRSRNIKTIGDLSSMSEIDIQSLPIRSPKVETVRKTLSRFQTSKTKSTKLRNDAPCLRLESKITSEEVKNLANQEEDPLKAEPELTKEEDNQQHSSSSSLLEKRSRVVKTCIDEMKAGISDPDSRNETFNMLVRLNEQIWEAGMSDPESRNDTLKMMKRLNEQTLACMVDAVNLKKE